MKNGINMKSWTGALCILFFLVGNCLADDWWNGEPDTPTVPAAAAQHTSSKKQSITPRQKKETAPQTSASAPVRVAPADNGMKHTITRQVAASKEKKPDETTVAPQITSRETPAPAAAEQTRPLTNDQKENPTDLIQVSRDDKGRAQSASRTNWQEGYIEVMAGATADKRFTVNRAHAYSVAVKTARHLAYEKLAETISGLHISANATYDRELQLDSNLKTEVQALVRNARVIKEESREFPDGSVWVEVTLGIDLYGENSVLRPLISWQLRKTPAAESPSSTRKSPEKLSSPQKQPRKHTRAKKKAAPGSQTTTQARTPQPQKPYTGLVVVATGLDAQPAMLPQIISEDGALLYGGRDVSLKYIKKYGVIAYQNSLDKALHLERVGNNPLVLRAKSTSGRFRADFVLSRRDAGLLQQENRRRDFLRQCRVAAVIN